MSSVVVVPPGDTGAGATDVLASAAGYALRSNSANTRRAYRHGFESFVAWCSRVGRRPLPASAETAAAFIAHCADCGLAVSTIEGRAAAIAYVHKLAGEPSPLSAESVKVVWRGVRRTLGVAANGKRPLTADLVAKVSKKLPNDISGIRDRALLILGFAAALRRSEIVALCVEDVERTPQGAFLHIRRSKGDQEGRGAQIAVPYGGKLKPIEALDAWLKAANIVSGPIFRRLARGGKIGGRLTSQSAALIVKRAAVRAKLDPKLFSGHSLRSGFVTSALDKGADLFRIMDVTRHREVSTLRKYDRRAKAFDNHPAKGIV